MRTYILKRVLGVVPTVLMITLVVFVMMRSVPGDPVVPLLGDAYTEEDAIKVREAYGLNKPVLVQYAIWLGKLVQGDWGTSILSGRPVLQDVLVRLPVTLELVVLSMGVALAIAIPAAIIGALRRNTWADYTATSVAMIGVSITEYVTTARAKGLAERPVVLKHALKNALIPTVTVMGLQVGFLIGGAIVVETLFAMPGLGTFGIDAIIGRDYQQVQGFALVTALAFVAINLIVDLTYTFLDPRIRYA